MQSCARHLTLKPHEGTSKNLNNYNRMVAVAVADGADIANVQALSDTTTSYTPGEVAVQTWLPGSTMRRIADPDLMGHTSKILHNALDLKIDQDGGLQLPNFVPIVGAAAQVLGPGEYLSASVRLAIGNSRAQPEPPPMPWFTIDHPYKLATVLGRMIPLTDVPVGTNVYLPATTSRGVTVGPGTTTTAQEMMKSGWKGVKELFGIPVRPSANIIPDVNDDVSGASFSQFGFVFVNEISPRMDPDTSDKSYRDATELNGWTSYAWGTWRPATMGVEILGDASTPVS